MSFVSSIRPHQKEEPDLLNIYLYSNRARIAEAIPPGLELITDVESEFPHGFRLDPVAKEIVDFIDEGQLLDRNAFVDRFGRILPTAMLSTGSKAALLIRSTEKAVDTAQCGPNALSAILSFGETGHIVIPCPYHRFMDCCPKREKRFRFRGTIYETIENLWRAVDDCLTF